MTKRILVPFLALGAAALAAPIAVGEKVPDLTLTTLGGEEIQLSSLFSEAENEGKIVVLASWSFKCPSGKPYIPYHKKLAAWCAERDVVYIAVAMYGEGKKKIEEYVAAESVEHKLAIDEGCRIAETFDTKVVNTAYVIDAQGVLRYAGGLPQREGEDLVQRAVEQLKAGEAVTTTSSRPSG